MLSDAEVAAFVALYDTVPSARRALLLAGVRYSDIVRLPGNSVRDLWHAVDELFDNGTAPDSVALLRANAHAKRPGVAAFAQQPDEAGRQTYGVVQRTVAFDRTGRPAFLATGDFPGEATFIEAAVGLLVARKRRRAASEPSVPELDPWLDRLYDLVAPHLRGTAALAQLDNQTSGDLPAAARERLANSLDDAVGRHTDLGPGLTDAVDRAKSAAETVARDHDRAAAGEPDDIIV